VKGEGWERGWFYVMVWTVVPTQFAGWGMWRLAGHFGWHGPALNQLRRVVFIAVAATFSLLGTLGKLPRTARYAALAEAA
jgi:hypothetical protein